MKFSKFLIILFLLIFAFNLAGFFYFVLLDLDYFDQDFKQKDIHTIFRLKDDQSNDNYFELSENENLVKKPHQRKKHPYDTDSMFYCGRENKQKPISTKEEISILFAGDLMFDRYIRQVAAQKGNDFIFGDMGSLLQKQDLVIANLEGPITTNASISQGTPMGSGKNMIFTFDPGLVKTLNEFNIKVVNIGNNHILNFGQKGVKQTKDFLDQGKIEYFGAVNQINNFGLIKDFKGIKIGFLNYNQFSHFQVFEEFKNRIGLYKDKCDLVIVYTHWDREYQTAPLAGTRQKAHKMIEEGADLIIGSHPHVVGEKEVYKGKKIYYSLGNFIFDQYFRSDTQSGLLVEVKIDPLTKTLTAREIFVEMKKNGQTKISKKIKK